MLCFVNVNWRVLFGVRQKHENNKVLVDSTVPYCSALLLSENAQVSFHYRD